MRALIDLAPWASDEMVIARYERFTWRGDPDGCAYWLGGISSSGHGKLHVGSRGTTRTTVLAHRLGYWLRHGPPPWPSPHGPTHLLCHTCDEHSCQATDHLVPGDHVDNALDWQHHRHRNDWPLADARGRYGRAAAIARAIRAAGPDVDAQRRAAAMAARVVTELEVHGQLTFGTLSVAGAPASLRRPPPAPVGEWRSDEPSPLQMTLEL